jgi:hypothetical protein
MVRRKPSFAVTWILSVASGLASQAAEPHNWQLAELTGRDVYGHIGGIAAPFSRKSQAIVDGARPKGAYIYHGFLRSTKDNPIGYEVEVTHLLGRNPTTKEYGVLYGDPGTLVKLDGTPPPEAARRR